MFTVTLCNNRYNAGSLIRQFNDCWVVGHMNLKLKYERSDGYNRVLRIKLLP